MSSKQTYPNYSMKLASIVNLKWAMSSFHKKVIVHIGMHDYKLIAL